MTDNRESHPRSMAVCLSLFAATPLLIIKLVFLSDAQGWNIAMGHGLILIVIPGFIVSWLIYLGVELFLKRKFIDGYGALPWFSIIAAVALFTFFHASEWSKSLVTQNPKWSRVTQVIDWETPEDRFILVLIARGNIEDHRYSSAYLNWTGEEYAGFSTIRFDPIRFGWWDGYNEVFVEGSLNTLIQRLSVSELPPEEVDKISVDLWQVLQDAKVGNEIHAAIGKVGDIKLTPFGNEHDMLGGVIWMACVTISMLVIGQLTLINKREVN